MTFEIRRDTQHAVIATTSPYQGYRFRSEARLAGKVYGEPFHVDVVSGGLMPRPPDRIAAGEFFGFAGIPPFEVAVYAREVHIAEKLHAYTYPYPVTNSRVRDLPDLGLLARSGPYDAVALHNTIAAVFAHRATHRCRWRCRGRRLRGTLSTRISLKRARFSGQPSTCFSRRSRSSCNRCWRAGPACGALRPGTGFRQRSIQLLVDLQLLDRRVAESRRRNSVITGAPAPRSPPACRPGSPIAPRAAGPRSHS